MKFFTDKKFTKRMIILLVVIIIFNVIAPIYHVSADGEDTDEEFGGKLFRPIFRFIAGIGDLVVRGLQKLLIGNGDIVIDNPRKIRQ